MMTRRVLLKSALLVPTVPALLTKFAAAQGGEPQNALWLERITQQLRDEFNLPAVWVAADIEDKIEAAVVGVKKWGNPTPATLDDKLMVASVSKVMAGLWIATLVDEGKLTYETKVLDVLPELQTDCLPEHSDVTLGQLLTHTAGVVRDAKDMPTALTLEQYPAERLRQARYILSTPSPTASKGKEVYSNNGLTLAATMAERVAGEPYEVAAGRFYRERLGLASWGVWAMNLPDDLSLPWLHSMPDNAPIPQSPQSKAFHFVRPSGSAHCTIADMVRFGLIATNATQLSKSILPPNVWATVTAPVPNTSTTLLSFRSDGERAAFNHSGSLSVTSSSLLVIPEWKVSVAVHTNATGDEFRSRGTDLIMDAIRKRRAELNPPPACRMTLTDVTTVDASWKNVIMPKTTDDKIRIRVRFHIEAQGRTSDLQTLVRLGGVEQRDDRYRGLVTGNHALHFVFDTPKTRTTPAIVTLDSLGTAGNRAIEAARFDSTLTLN